MAVSGLLTAGAAIVSRLKARCASVNGNVFVTDDLANVKDAAQVSPALHVLLGDYEVEDRAGGEVNWRETWIVVAVVRHSARTSRAQSQRENAAQIIAEALAALSGWRPGPPVAGALTVVTGPRPRIIDTHAYFPLAFEAHVVSAGASHDL
jgi:hypothetical protein